MANPREPKLVVLAPELDRERFEEFADNANIQFQFHAIPPRPIHYDAERLQEILAYLERHHAEDFGRANLTNAQMNAFKLKYIATVIACNGLFVAANLCSNEDQAWQNELSLSVLLPVMVGFLSFVWQNKPFNLGLGITGGTTGFIAASLNQLGAPLTLAPVVTIPAAVAACIDNKRVDAWTATAYEKTSQALSYGMNKFFDFWQRNRPKRDSAQPITATQNSLEQTNSTPSHQRRFGN